MGAYAAKTYTKHLQLMGLIALIPAIGFMHIYFTGSRPVGLETGGKPIWWNDLRPVHAINYFAFSYLAFMKNKCAYIPLAIDVFIGLFAWLVNKMIGYKF